jgi:glycosyltransferase involved in cell wall biosynthesis
VKNDLGKMHRGNNICIVTQSHLCQNPRVLKEAITLSKNGYRISILNINYSKELRSQDFDLIKKHAITIFTVSNLDAVNLRSLTDRLVKKIGVWLIKYLKCETYLALGYGATRYLSACKSINADLYICHQELSTCIGTRLIKLGFKVAFDFEDWYSEDLLPEARAERPVRLLQEIEKSALEKGIFNVTTSEKLALRLAKAYQVQVPTVIYNVFPSTPHLFQLKKNYQEPIKLFWFSQTVGPGRGIEEFIQLLRRINKATELHLLGNVTTNYKEKLMQLMPSKHLLKFHPPVAAIALPDRIAMFDIGLALEKNEPLSRNFTITNKFFQYLQAGLPVIATDTEGQREGFGTYQPGFMLGQHPSAVEIAALDAWLSDPGALREAREKAIAAAGHYNWEVEAKKIIYQTYKAVGNTR